MHEKTPQTVYRNSDCSHKELLKMIHYFTVHQRNIQSLAIELFKVEQNISKYMRNNIFQIRENLRWNLRSQTEFLRSSASKSQCGLKFLREFNSKLWNMVPAEIKNSTNFKEKVRNWETKNCNCKLVCHAVRILDICYLNSVLAVLKNQPH